MRSYAIYEIVKQLTPKKQRKEIKIHRFEHDIILQKLHSQKEYENQYSCWLQLVRELDVDTSGNFDFDEKFENVSFVNSLPFSCPEIIKLFDKNLLSKKIGEKLIIKCSGNTPAFLNYSVLENVL